MLSAFENCESTCRSTHLRWNRPTRPGSNRPAAPTRVSIRHERGRFLAAFKDEASEQNERATIRLATDRGEIAFTLVAGLIARRIVVRVREGQSLAAGERIGLIRFGSRVDLDLPAGAAPAVRIGDRVAAGESVLARFGS
jgi:phosphatidylserine decarboxylase